MLAELYLLFHLATSRPQIVGSPNVVLASHTISLENRYGNKYVNDVFKDNILLALNYLNGDVKGKNDVNWTKVTDPTHFEFTLKPGEEFAFHDKTLPKYSEDVVKTTNSHFSWDQGYKSDGYLVGDGVCHLASLIYWAAKDADLNPYAPSNHNFAVIPEIPKEYGVAILYPSPLGNMYIRNNKLNPITFVFDYDGTNLNVQVTEELL